MRQQRGAFLEACAALYEVKEAELRIAAAEGFLYWLDETQGLEAVARHYVWLSPSFRMRAERIKAELDS